PLSRTHVSGFAEALAFRALQDPDDEAIALQRLHQLAHMLAVAGLDRDVEAGPLGDHAAEQPLVLHLDDVTARLADPAGNTRELARQVVDHDAQPHDPAIAYQAAQQHRGQEAGVDVTAAQHQPDLAALEDLRIDEQRGQARGARAFGHRLLDLD